MATFTIKQHYSTFIRRSRLAWISAGTLILLVTFFLHDWYAETIAAEFGMSDRAVVTGSLALVLIGFMGMQRLLSLAFYKDLSFGFDAVLRDTRPRCPANMICERVA